MKFPDNIQEIIKLPIEYIGFIFYEKSPRFLENLNLSEVYFPENIQKVGVFVNEKIDTIIHLKEYYSLDYIQLHGNESSEYCQALTEKGCKIIKAFSIYSKEDLLQTDLYENTCDFFLFDTKTSSYGGSGQQFDWNILNSYNGNKNFFLSGGIGMDDVKRIGNLNHPRLHAIDLNSRFETQPGRKDVDLLKCFMELMTPI